MSEHTHKWTPEMKEIVSKSYDWMANVVKRQGRFLDDKDFWTAYPFKRNGMTKEGLKLLREKMQACFPINEIEIPD